MNVQISATLTPGGKKQKKKIPTSHKQKGKGKEETKEWSRCGKSESGTHGTVENFLIFSLCLKENCNRKSIFKGERGTQ